MKTICVYLGASSGNNEIFSQSVVLLGKEIASLGLTLVYGGSGLGMMGLLAKTVKEAGGDVIGVITQHLLDIEKPLDILDELWIVDSMLERKQLMQQKADMFLVMPGGLGTLEEAFETWNAIKMGIVDKPIGFLNVAGYFEQLFAFMNVCQRSGFVLTAHRKIPFVNSDVSFLLSELNRNLMTTDSVKSEISRVSC